MKYIIWKIYQNHKFSFHLKENNNFGENHQKSKLVVQKLAQHVFFMWHEYIAMAQISTTLNISGEEWSFHMYIMDINILLHIFSTYMNYYYTRLLLYYHSKAIVHFSSFQDSSFFAWYSHQWNVHYMPCKL